MQSRAPMVCLSHPVSSSLLTVLRARQRPQASQVMDFEKQLAAYKTFFEGKVVRPPLLTRYEQLLTSPLQDFAGQARTDQLTRQILWTTGVRP